MKIDELKQLLTLTWDYKICSHRLTDDSDKGNTSIEQCAITSLIVNDLFGGKIMRCMSSLGNHYYNLIEGKIIDLIEERFLDEKPKYEDGVEITREYLLSDNDTKNKHENYFII